MKKRLFIIFVVSIISTIMCFSLIGCNSTKKPEIKDEITYDDSVKLEISEELSSIDSPLRLSSSGFTEFAPGALMTTVTATIKPDRLNSSTYLYWTVYDTNNVPTDGYNWGTSQSPDDIIDLDYSNSNAVDSHKCTIVVHGGFKGTTYKLLCSTRNSESISLDAEVTIKYDGAPSSYICNNGDTVSGSSFVLTEGSSQSDFIFRYTNYFDVLGTEHESEHPFMSLLNVQSKYSVGANLYDIYMVFKYTSVTTGYLYLRLADYYSLFINDNLTPKNMIQPVDSSFVINAVSSPDNYKHLFDIGERSGFISDFKGYCVSPTFNSALHYFDELHACTFIDHEDAIIKFNLHGDMFGDFSLRFRIEPILSGIDLGIDEILV